MNGNKLELVVVDGRYNVQDVYFVDDKDTDGFNLWDQPLTNRSKIVLEIRKLLLMYGQNLSTFDESELRNYLDSDAKEPRYTIRTFDETYHTPRNNAGRMVRTKLFMDMEFTGLHKNTTLISVGIVSECGKSFYAESIGYDLSQVNDWIQENVIDNLILGGMEEKTFRQDGERLDVKGCNFFIGRELRLWLQQFGPVEIWTDTGAYDWVLWNDLFLNALEMTNLNPNVCYIPFDLSTRLYERGIDPNVDREEFARGGEYWYTEEEKKHNALWDAKVIKACWDHCENLPYHIVAATNMAAMREYYKIQGQQGHYDGSEGMLGMYNGIEIMMAALDNREPVFHSSSEIKKTLSNEEIVLMKLRAEFDYLWHLFNRDKGIETPDGVHGSTAVQRYGAALETLLLNLLGETKYEREQFGTDGVAGLIRNGLIPDPNPISALNVASNEPAPESDTE